MKKIMSEIEIKRLVDLLTESIGIEAAEKVIHEAISTAGLPIKTSYSE